MIKELREIGRVNSAPILIVLVELATKDWVGLAYKNNLESLSICFWSVRDEQRVPTNELVREITQKVATLRDADARDRCEMLFDMQYEQPEGWDRWLGGVPRPLRNFFDEHLHATLKRALQTVR